MWKAGSEPSFVSASKGRILVTSRKLPGPVISFQLDGLSLPPVQYSDT